MVRETLPQKIYRTCNMLTDALKIENIECSGNIDRRIKQTKKMDLNDRY